MFKPYIHFLSFNLLSAFFRLKIIRYSLFGKRVSIIKALTAY